MFEDLIEEDKVILAQGISDTWTLFKRAKGVDGETTFEQFSAFFDGVQTGMMLGGMSQDDWWEVFDLVVEL